MNSQRTTRSQRKRSRSPAGLPVRSTKKLKGETFFNNPDRLIESRDSPLYKDTTNIKKILAHPLATETLSGTQHGDQLRAAEYDLLAGAAAAFKEDGLGGRHDQEWVCQAQTATETRQAGGFQEYEEEQFSKQWAAESKELSEEEDEDEIQKKEGKGCGGDSKYLRKHDEFDGGDGGAGTSGGKNTGFGSALYTGYGNAYEIGDIAYGNSSTNFGDSKYDNTRSDDFYSGFSPTEVAPTAMDAPGPMYEMNYSSDEFDPTFINWRGRGYCDNPLSIYLKVLLDN